MECVDMAEVISNEELLAKFNRINVVLKDARMRIDLKKSMIASLDTEGLYPSLDAKECSEMCQS